MRNQLLCCSKEWIENGQFLCICSRTERTEKDRNGTIFRRSKRKDRKRRFPVEPCLDEGFLSGRAFWLNQPAPLSCDTRTPPMLYRLFMPGIQHCTLSRDSIAHLTLPVYDGVHHNVTMSHPPGPIFQARHLHSRNSAGAKKDGV